MAINIKKEVLRIAGAWSDASTTTFAAAVAYYTVFSIAPLLLIAIATAGLVVGEGAAQASIMEELRLTFGEGAASFIQSVIAAQSTQSESVVYGLLGIGAILFGASGVFSGLQHGLDRIFEKLPQKVHGTLLRAVLDTLYSIGMVLSLGFVLVASLAVSALIRGFAQQLGTVIPNGVAISTGIELAFSFVLLSLFLAVMLRLLPSERLGWRPALKGGLVGGVLFSIGKYALALYLSSSSVASAYGAASSLVLLILWAYYLSLAFFLSAILTRLYFVRTKN
jgi:membrane protein